MHTGSVLDKFIMSIDSALRTLSPPDNRISTRPVPGSELPESNLSLKDKRHVAGLMRINHAGEVCAQALYQGQALTAKLTHVKQQMEQAALEEIEHLAWCESRLRELGSKPGLFNPFWYAGSLFIGAMAGLAGDAISLGFVAETENQVSAHLKKHLSRLPEQDLKSRSILNQMDEDELRHADLAKQAGGIELPKPIKQLMHITSKIMTKVSYHL